MAVASLKPRPSLFTGSAFLSLMFGYKNSRFSAFQKVYAKQIWSENISWLGCLGNPQPPNLIGQDRESPIWRWSEYWNLPNAIVGKWTFMPGILETLEPKTWIGYHLVGIMELEYTPTYRNHFWCKFHRAAVEITWGSPSVTHGVPQSLSTGPWNLWDLSFKETSDLNY